MKRRRVYWICQVAGWFTYAAVYSLVAMVSAPGQPAARVVVVFVGGSTVAIGWTHGYRWAIRRWRWALLGYGQLAARIAVACVVLGVAITATVALVWWLVLGDLGKVAAWGPAAVTSWSVSVFMWSVTYFGVHHFERVRQLEVAQLQLAVVAKDAQLHGLMAQLQPHFLFNCLNCVRALIVEDPAKAQATVTALSSLLRYSLQATKDSMVPLASELEMVRTYLELERVRFDDRLRSEIAVADGVAALRVPAMLVQSLVENGVKHGVERAPAGGTIRIAAWCSGGALRIRVVNPGQLGRSPPSTQIGLANARERLRLLYGPAATIALSDGDARVIAEVSIPVAGEPDASRGPA